MSGMRFFSFFLFLFCFRIKKFPGSLFTALVSAVLNTAAERLTFLVNLLHMSISKALTEPNDTKIRHYLTVLNRRAIKCELCFS